MLEIIHANIQNNVTPGIWQRVDMFGLDHITLKKLVIVGFALSLLTGSTVLWQYIGSKDVLSFCTASLRAQ